MKRAEPLLKADAPLYAGLPDVRPRPEKPKEEKKEAKPQPNFYVKDYKPISYEEAKRSEPKDDGRKAVMAAAKAV